MSSYTLTTYQCENTHREGPHGSAKALRYQARVGLVYARIPVTKEIRNAEGTLVYRADLDSSGCREWLHPDWAQMTAEPQD